MIKKIISFIVLSAMVFSLIACWQETPLSSSELIEYKTKAKDTIETYAEEKMQEVEIAENLAVIEEIVTQAKTMVDEASTKSQIDKSVDSAVQAIDNVCKKDNLQMDEKQILTKELLDKINQDYLSEYKRNFYYDHFYGIYSGAAAFFIGGDDCVIKTVKISNVEFSYNYGWTILVWKDGKFYNLENYELILENSILTQKDIEEIGKVHMAATI